MSATATTRTKRTGIGRTRGKATGEGAGEDGSPKRRPRKRRTSEKQKAANQRNSQKSTGPRTPDGKGNSKFNAYKHGMTARSVLLPGEKAEELAVHQQHYIDSFQPRHAVELAIVERMALDIWRADRAERGAGVRIAERLRHEPLEKAKKEQDEAIELGGRLFWQPSFPLPISRRFPVGKLTEPQCAESPVHPHHPARLRLRLEQTLSGCDWLIARWQELSQQLYFNKLWLTADNFHMVRLMGKHAIDMVDSLDVVRVFLCGLTLLSASKGGPEREAFDWKDALIKMLVTFDLENKRGIAASAAKKCEPFARRLAELPLAKLAPRDENHARSWLIGIVDQELRRLQDIRLYLQVVAQADEAEAPARLAFETGPEGDRQRRYGLSAERLVIKRFGDFLKTRGQIMAGMFDPTEVELQDLLGSASPSVVSCPLSVVSGSSSVVGGGAGVADAPGVPDRVVSEIVDREVVVPNSEFADGCDDAQFLRNEAISPFVSGPLSVVSGPVSVVGGEAAAADAPGVPDQVVPEIVDGEAVVPNPEFANGYDDARFLRNEAISPIVGGSLSVVEGEAAVADAPGVPDPVLPAIADREVVVPNSEFADGCDDAVFLRNEAISPSVSGPLSVADRALSAVGDESLVTEPGTVRPDARKDVCVRVHPTGTAECGLAVKKRERFPASCYHQTGPAIESAVVTVDGPEDGNLERPSEPAGDGTPARGSSTG